MAMWFLVNFSKIAGVAGIATVAANTIAYIRFRKRRLAPFEAPIDESQEILASFPIDKPAEEDGFFFAVATAPAHVEDNLQDAWLDFAQQTKPGKKPVQEASMPDEDVKKDSYTFQQAPHQILAAASGEGPASEKGLDSKALDSISEWEVVGNGTEKKPTDKKQELEKELERIEDPYVKSKDNNLGAGEKLRRAGSTVEEPTLQYNVPKKGKRLMKVALEATLRGIERYTEDNEPQESKMNVAAWHNVIRPEERVRFWSDPDTELRLAKETNVTVFRLGVDWTRIMPVEPVDGIEKAVNWEAVKRYKWILERVHAHGMRIMLTLFHHSLPPWAAEYGGWKVEKTLNYFLEFTRLAVEEYAGLVDYWITFNEPHVFAMLTYCAGAWPGGHPDLLETATAIMPKGVFNRAMQQMAVAHLKAYDMIHEISKRQSKSTKVGVAHHVSFVRPYGLFDVSAAILSNWKTHFPYVDDICEKLDYLGINYYGQELISAPGLKLVDNEEYSESGRGVYPDGLYRVLLDFHNRYKKLGFPFIITENGVSDATDYIRRPYITEHLLAIRAAMNKGVPVRGYCFWTTSDNWEWADGYGPKFGLAAVDRRNNLARIPRPSYYLFAEIARTGKVTRKQRNKAWRELQSAAAKGQKRPFYRAVDKNGRMYAGGLDVPIERPFAQRDWRFGHYVVDELQDPLSRAFNAICHTVLLRRRSSQVVDNTWDEDEDSEQQGQEEQQYPQPALESEALAVGGHSE